MKKVFKIVIWSLAVFFVVCTFYLLWKQAQPIPVVYELIEPSVRDLVKKTVATGKITPRKQVNIKPQITGIITELNIKPGDILVVGQVVAKIKVIPDMVQLNQVKSQIEMAHIECVETEREFKRTKALYNKDVVSREEYEQAEAKLSSAREKVKAAESQLEVVTTGTSIRTGKINTTIVTSTQSGTVLSVSVKEGSSVSATSVFSDGTTICTIADMSDVQFKGNIDETEVAKLSVGMPINLILGAMQNVKVSARLEYISPEGIEQNGATLFEVKAEAHIPEGISLRSGYSVNAAIILDEEKQVLTIDETAVEFVDDQAFVYRLVSAEDDINQRFDRVFIEVGLSDGIYIQVKNGIKKGDKIRGIQN